MKRLFLTIVAISISAVLFAAGFAIALKNNGSHDPKSLAKLPSVALGETAGSLVPPANIEISVGNPNIVLPKALPVYKIVQANISDQEVTNIASELGVNGPVETSQDGTTKYVKEGDTSAIVDVRTGAITFNAVNPDAEAPEEPKNLPTLADAKGIARKFLQDSGFNTLEELEGFTEKASVSLTRDHWDPIKKDWSGPIPYELAVSYRGKISGCSVDGPGAKIVVFIGDNDKVLRALKWWPRLSEDQAYPLKDQAMIIAAIKAGDSDGLIVPANTTALDITDIEPVYWAAPLPEGEDYYQPVFLVKGKAKPSGTEFKTHVVAIQDQYYNSSSDVNKPQM